MLKDNIKNIKGAIVAIGYMPEPGKVAILGSGFCVSKNQGFIMTVAHLLQQIPHEHQDKIKAFVLERETQDYFGNYKWIGLELVKQDIANDVAIFKLADSSETLLNEVQLGDSNTVDVGQNVYYIGFPYAANLIIDGFGVSLIANKGIISSIKRDGVNPEHKRNWIFVDSISNPGNSGCPLFDIESNKVIGVMSISFQMKSQLEKYADLDVKMPMHIAGAKPVNLAKELLNSIR